MRFLTMSCVVIACLFIAAATPVADANIIIRHDRPDSAYRALGARYADVLAHVEDRVESVLLASRWVLTAAHAVETIGPFDQPFATIRGQRYGIDRIIIHSEWEGGWDDILSNHDLALLRLDRPVSDVRPITLYPGDDETGLVVTILGRGRTGTGVTGQVGEKGKVVRGATNRIDGASSTALLLHFGIDNDPTDLEGLAGAGDSGGPALLERGDTLYLVGIGSAGTMQKGYSAYGTFDIYTRVSAFRDWIENTIAANPRSTTDWSEPVRLGTVPTWPATPVGQLAADFFVAYSGGTSALEAFHRKHGNPDADGAAWAQRIRSGLVDALGPLLLHSVATAGPHMIQVLVYAPSRDLWRSIGLNTSPDPPHRMSRLYMKNEAPPR